VNRSNRFAPARRPGLTGIKRSTGGQTSGGAGIDALRQAGDFSGGRVFVQDPFFGGLLDYGFGFIQTCGRNILGIPADRNLNALGHVSGTGLNGFIS